MQFPLWTVQSEFDLAFGIKKLDTHADAGKGVDHTSRAFNLRTFGCDAEAELDLGTRHERVGSVQEEAASAHVAADEDLINAETLAPHIQRLPVALAEASFDPNFHRLQEPESDTAPRCRSLTHRLLPITYAITDRNRSRTAIIEVRVARDRHS